MTTEHPRLSSINRARMDLDKAMAGIAGKYELRPAERLYILHAEMVGQISTLLHRDLHQQPPPASG